MEAKFYGLEGQQITMEEWGELTSSERKIVAQTKLPGGCFVSTVLTGFDYSFGSGPPIIFETMVFASDDNFTDLDMDRYSTKEEAEAGHERMVTKWTGWTPGDEFPED